MGAEEAEIGMELRKVPSGIRIDLLAGPLTLTCLQLMSHGGSILQYKTPGREQMVDFKQNKAYEEVCEAHTPSALGSQQN